MKIKQFVVTYNNPSILNDWCLKSYYESLSSEELNQIELNIINNHSNFKINDEFRDQKINVFHNVLRPDFSTGHLARSWNQGIINGFKSLTNLDADIVILVQHDTIFEKNYLNTILDIHSKGINCLFCGTGDQLISLTPESIKQVGLFDERFVSIGLHEADFLMRNLLYNQDKCSFNDFRHGRIWNPIKNTIVKQTETGYDRKDKDHSNSSVFYEYNLSIWNYKYNYPFHTWDTSYILSHKEDIVNNVPWFVFYPYFEKDIPAIHKQGCLKKTTIVNDKLL